MKDPSGLGMDTDHAYEVTIDLLGNFDVPESSLRGAKAVKKGEKSMRTYTELRIDKCYLRPLSAPVYRGAALCCACGGDSIAAQRGGIKIVAAAEHDTNSHEVYERYVGVTPFSSNKELIEAVPNDIVMVTFGTECRSMSDAGNKDGLGRTTDWATFDEVVDYLERDKVLCFHYENVAGLFEDKAFDDVKKHVFGRFKKEYVIKAGVANAADFGSGASRRRTHVIGMRREAAKIAGFTSGGIITSPFLNKPCYSKCVADFIVDRHGPVEEGQIELDAWAYERAKVYGEGWWVEWNDGYKTREERDAVTRKEGVEGKVPITLGYVRKEGLEADKHTGWKVGHVNGLLHGLTHVKLGLNVQGPGENCALYYDHLNGQVRSLTAETVRRIWDLEFCKRLSIRDIGKMAHPAGTQANILWLTLHLDQYFARTRSVPPMPRIAFESVTDVYSVAGLIKIRNWKRRVVRFVLGCRSEPDKDWRAPAALALKDSDIEFWARGWVFDLRGKKPVRMERLQRPRHALTLRKLKHMEDYTDTDVFTICDDVGSAQGSNGRSNGKLVSNDKGLVDQEEIALDIFDKQVELGIVALHLKIPFCPIQIHPHFMVEQGDKHRPITHCSKEVNGASLNSSRMCVGKAKMSLINHDCFVRKLKKLLDKAVYLISEGYDCEILLWVVDLWKAYNQFAVDFRNQWQLCSSFVTLKGIFMYMELLRTSFGTENAPMSFSRLTAATMHSIDADLKESEWYTLQQEFRELMARRGITRVPEQDIEPTIPSKRSRAARKKEELETSWRNGEELEGLVATDQILQPETSTSKDEDGKLYTAATYLDDCFGGFVIWKHSTPHTDAEGGYSAGDPPPIRKRKGRRAHPGGRMTSNVEEARRKFEARKGITLPETRVRRKRGPCRTSGADRGNHLRKRHVKELYEAAGFIVVGDDRSQEKYDRGGCNTVMLILGILYDFTDLSNPTARLPEEKREKLKAMVEKILDAGTRQHPELVRIDLGDYQTLVGTLNDASKVVRSGRVYMCGLYAAREGKDGRVPIDAWPRRNLVWWAKFLRKNGLPRKLYRRTMKTAKKFCPHTDASTGFGFGGFWIIGGVCYYIFGKWTDQEKKLIDSANHLFTDAKGVEHKMGINFLEMAAVWMMLAAIAEEVDKRGVELTEDGYTFFCDNETTVKILNSYATRTLPTATLLENIDLFKETQQKTMEWEWLSTKINTESDLLSRGEEDEFKDFVRDNHGIFSFVHMQVPDHARDITEVVATALRNPHWIVADGESKEEWRPGPHA